MNLINKTKISDKCLQKILVKAARSVAAKSDIIVIVRPSLYRTNGYATKCFSVRLRKTEKWLDTNGGYINFNIPTKSSLEPLSLAISIYNTLRHEFAHIKDYQDGNTEFSGRGGKRKPAWGKRPEEIRAMDIVDGREEYDTEWASEEVLNLAIEIESLINKK